MHVEQYRPVILTFESEHSYANPFLDVSINASFTYEDKTIIREAYWDGGNIYRISFAPTEVGTWDYVLSAPSETGLNGIYGTVECVPYTGDLELYKHGFVKVMNEHHLCYADGTPFFWLGDTHWEFAYREDYDDMFRYMVDKRFEQGYTVYQTNLRSDAMMGGDKLYWDGDVPNISFYQNELDRRFAYVADKGIVNALGLCWFMSVNNNIPHIRNLARYIIARYGAYPLIYTLAGEVGGYDLKAQPALLEQWKEVADYMYEMDGYPHLHTVHYTNERPFPEYFQDEPWMDFTLNQGGHGDFVISPNDYRSFLAKHGDKPFVEGEAMYEFCSTLEENGPRMCTPDMVRRVAYMTIQLGGCGYTYGAQGIWDCIKDKEHFTERNMVFNRYHVTWYEAIEGEAGKQMGYMKDFYLDNDYTSMLPYVNEADTNLLGRNAPFVSLNEDHTKLIAYYVQTARKNVTVELPDGDYVLTWFNPREGTYSKETTINISEPYTLPKKPDEFDWALVLKKC